MFHQSPMAVMCLVDIIIVQFSVWLLNLPADMLIKNEPCGNQDTIRAIKKIAHIQSKLSIYSQTWRTEREKTFGGL